MFVTKTNLNKIIKWSTSRYCEFRKKDIINKIMSLKNGDDFSCSTGSYSERGHLYGCSYYIYRNNNKLCIDDGNEIWELIYKEIKNG